MPPDPAAIARRLSPAQKRALLWLPANGKFRIWEKGSEAPLFVMKDLVIGDPKKRPAVYCCLCELGETRVASSHDVFRFKRCWSITPLGLAVRDELQRMEARDE